MHTPMTVRWQWERACAMEVSLCACRRGVSSMLLVAVRGARVLRTAADCWDEVEKEGDHTEWQPQVEADRPENQRVHPANEGRLQNERSIRRE